MAHLIKLKDCVSRYQYDIYRYSSQFTRLKRERWERLKEEWQQAQEQEHTMKQFAQGQQWRVRRFLDKLRPTKKKLEMEFEMEQQHVFRFQSLESVKQMFLKELYQFQLRWATSTIAEKSYLHKSYLKDAQLKWLLQSFPDSYFLLYYPIIIYPKAATEFDILLIGPTEIWCLVILEGEDNSIFQFHSERYWLLNTEKNERKIINPFLALNRMSTVLSQIMEDCGESMAIRKAVVTKKGYIDAGKTNRQTVLVDQRNLTQWQETLKKNTTPVKHVQLKFSQRILNVCETIAEKRLEFGDTDVEM